MSAVNDIQLLCETVLHFNADGLRKFNFSRNDLFQQWTSSFVETMNESTNNMFSKEQSFQIANALMNSLQKVKVTVDASYSESKVEITVNGMDFEKEFAPESLHFNIMPGAEPKEIAVAVVKAIVDKFDEMKPSKSTVFSIDCEFDKKSNFWMPKDLQEFFKNLSVNAMGGK